MTDSWCMSPVESMTGFNLCGVFVRLIKSCQVAVHIGMCSLILVVLPSDLLFWCSSILDGCEGPADTSECLADIPEGPLDPKKVQGTSRVSDGHSKCPLDTPKVCWTLSECPGDPIGGKWWAMVLVNQIPVFVYSSRGSL